MSQDYPIPRQDSRSDGVATVEWGDQDEPRRPGRRGDLLARLGRDPRLVPVVAGIGAVAIFASLVGEWTIMLAPNFGPDGGTVGRTPIGVSDSTNFGSAYLFGIFGIVGCLALVIFGTAAVRRNVRVLGLALTGTVLAVLVAASLTLDDVSRLGLGEDTGLRIEYGRGLVMAYVGTAVLGLALYLAGRLVGPDPVPTGSSATGVDGVGSAESAPEAAFSWRRPMGSGGPDDELDEAPRDLTVGPTTPFASPEQPDAR
ncbi:hypothetical protein OG792_33950 [Micromonospora sp. NBC_01699]|uniref:hypothetical protein n=1 Tax=Micromonospora sp. NBC_01699 TaxID=2975984 RepID=UPI002E29F29A|nr:hypothetical protein [Micromonospora sp. NBC_01699]